ncbi:MAG TPA: hypothetical protein VGR62_23015 [Candidatus Binatia bacterium]|nr:hypothetical protein [Candidatus Binatia bacterium]
MMRLLAALALMVTIGMFAIDWEPMPPTTTTTTLATTSTSTSTTVTTTSTLASAPVTDAASAEQALRERGVDPEALSKEIAEQMKRRFQPTE